MPQTVLEIFAKALENATNKCKTRFLHCIPSWSCENTRAMCKFPSKLTIKTPEQRSAVFIVNFEQIVHIVLLFLLLVLTL